MARATGVVGQARRTSGAWAIIQTRVGQWTISRVRHNTAGPLPKRRRKPVVRRRPRRATPAATGREARSISRGNPIVGRKGITSGPRSSRPRCDSFFCLSVHGIDGRCPATLRPHFLPIPTTAGAVVRIAPGGLHLVRTLQRCLLATLEQSLRLLRLLPYVFPFQRWRGEQRLAEQEKSQSRKPHVSILKRTKKQIQTRRKPSRGHFHGSDSRACETLPLRFHILG